MDWSQQHEEIMRTVGDELGSRHTFIWHRQHRLKVNSAVPVTLTVKIAALAGVSALTLYAGAALALEGDVYKDLVITIAGTDYSLSTDASAASSALVVSFTPVLAADVSIDDVVTVAGTVEITKRLDGELLWGLKEELDLVRIDAYGLRAFTFRVPKNSAPLVPKAGHRIDIPELGFLGVVKEIFDETAALWPLAVDAA